MSPKQERINLIRNALTCRQALRVYGNPISRGVYGGYFVLIKKRLRELRAERNK